jgi:hypothetical protein
MLPLALAAFAEPFIPHVIFVFVTINIVIEVGISAGIDIHVTPAPVGMAPRITPRGGHRNTHPK